MNHRAASSGLIGRSPSGFGAPRPSAGPKAKNGLVSRTTRLVLRNDYTLRQFNGDIGLAHLDESRSLPGFRAKNECTIFSAVALMSETAHLLTLARLSLFELLGELTH